MFLVDEKLGPPLLIEKLRKDFKGFFETYFVVYISRLT